MMASEMAEAYYAEDEYGIPVAQPLGATHPPRRRLLRWGAGVALILVISGIVWQWQTRMASSTHGAVGVYLATTQAIAALQANGSQQWQRSIDGTIMGVQQKTLVIKRATSSLAIASPNGKIVWTTTTPSAGESLSTADGIIYNGPTDQQINAETSTVFGAQDATTGVKLWSVALPVGNGTTVAADSQHVYVGLFNAQQTVTTQTLSAYDTHTGVLRWQVQLPNTWYVFPQVLAGHLYAMARDAFYALDATTGQITWQAQAAITATPVASGGTIYLATGNRLTAYDATTGVARWRMNVASDTLTSLSMAQGLVIAQSAHTFTVMDAHGVVRWHVEGQPQMTGTFVVVDALLYFQDESGITAYRLADGLWRWHFATAQPVSMTLLASNNTLYAVRGASLYALNCQTGQQLWHYQGTAPILAVLLATA